MFMARWFGVAGFGVGTSFDPRPHLVWGLGFVVWGSGLRV